MITNINRVNYPRHIEHHGSIYCPVGSAEVVPIDNRFRLGLTVLVTATAATFQGLIAQPIRPLVVAVLGGHSCVLVLRFADVLKEVVHRIPVMFYNNFIPELFPDGPRYDDTRISPAKTHHIAVTLAVACSVLCQRCNAWESPCG